MLIYQTTTIQFRPHAEAGLSTERGANRGKLPAHSMDVLREETRGNNSHDTLFITTSGSPTWLLYNRGTPPYLRTKRINFNGFAFAFPTKADVVVGRSYSSLIGLGNLTVEEVVALVRRNASEIPKERISSCFDE